MSEDVQHDQLPSIEEAKTNASAKNSDVSTSKSLLGLKALSAFLLLTTIALSTTVGILANVKRKNGRIIRGSKRIENLIRNTVTQKGLAKTPSEYKITARSIQQRALDMVMKKSGMLTGDLMVQEYALWCLYFSTEHVFTKTTNEVFGVGTAPRWKDSWINDGQDPCLWNGIRCNSNGIVVEIHLSDGHITGSLPQEMKLLDSLTKLDLRDNPGLGDGGLPLWLQDIATLNFVDIRECTFSGDVPTDFCDAIDSLYADCKREDFSCSCCNLC